MQYTGSYYRLGGVVLQYKQTVLWQEGLQEENCVAIQNCIATERLGSAQGAQVGAGLGVQQARSRRWGDKRAGASGSAGVSGQTRKQ